MHLFWDYYYVHNSLGPVNISPETSIAIVGRIFNISCSADIVIIPLSQDTFEWFFGPDNSSLPTSGSVSSVTNTYTSSLQFFSLNQSNAGMYTCRIRGNEQQTLQF